MNKKSGHGALLFVVTVFIPNTLPLIVNFISINTSAGLWPGRWASALDS